MILMYLPDVLKFLNRIGVRNVNDHVMRAYGGVDGVGDDVGTYVVKPLYEIDLRAADLSAVVVSFACGVQPVTNHTEVQDMMAIHKHSSASSVLSNNTFVVSSRNDSMYGKRMRDVHFATFLVNSNAVIRFRKSDHKVVVADMLVGVGRYDAYNIANRAVQKFIAKKDDKISDLSSMEVDKTLSTEQVNICLYYHTRIGRGIY